jgi:glycine/D-amino acid oxidase-like deaminating enzyme
MKIAILGGGVIGVTTAYYLARVEALEPPVLLTN